MDQPARLYLCARCRVQVVLCSRCDRGNRYCGWACSRQARQEARRQAAQRYQRSWRGRITHAQRSRRWRQRRAARGAADGTGDDTDNVTHQGSRPGVGSAVLVAWTHHSSTVEPADTAESAESAQSARSAQSILAHGAAQEPTIARVCWVCRRCGQRQPAAVRLGYLRHGLSGQWRHDHSP
jgi:hypothetical protein